MTLSAKLTLPFALLFALMFTAPALLSQQFGLYDLMKYGDVLDLFTPLVLLPLYWWLWQGSRKTAPRPGELILFLVLAALWVEGQGMHLSANSIGHLLGGMQESDAYTLTYFYDEKLSHYLWHLGIVGLSAMLLYREWRQPGPLQTTGWPVIAGGVIHGLTYFMIIVEAGTGPLGVTFAAVVSLAVLVWGRGNLGKRPLLTFFFITYLLATILFIGWAAYWGGLLEFSDPRVGWIT